jgi:DNA-binding response OmpR family regulator
MQAALRAELQFTQIRRHEGKSQMNFWVSAMTATPGAPLAVNPVRDARLTRKERDLLALLMGSPGRVFSRDLLHRTIWDYGEGARTRTVDVHVQRIRRKLGPESPGQQGA